MAQRGEHDVASSGQALESRLKNLDIRGRDGGSWAQLLQAVNVGRSASLCWLGRRQLGDRILLQKELDRSILGRGE